MASLLGGISGVIPATPTPFKNDQSLNIPMIKPLVEKLINDGVSGLFILGTTGEGNLMTVVERKEAAEAFIDATRKRIPVFVHIGHASLYEAQNLAKHAAEAGADAIAALPPYYHRPETIEAIVECLEVLSSAANGVPMLYYHYPAMSGVHLDPFEILKAVAIRVPALAGIKFSQNDVAMLAACCSISIRHLDAFWGVDESLLAAIVAGATGGIGSSYNYASKLYQPILRFAAERENRLIEEAQIAQERSRKMLSVINKNGGIAAHKAVMSALGIDCGPTRLPLNNLTKNQHALLIKQLEDMGFFNWIAK